jgi:hypothetical protein
MTMKKKTLSLLLFIALLGLLPPSALAWNETEVRSAVQNVFQQLKSQNYGALYDLLPGTARTRMSRERFVGALQRTQGFYQLDRMDIGTIKISGTLQWLTPSSTDASSTRYKLKARSSRSSISYTKTASGAWPWAIKQH